MQKKMFLKSIEIIFVSFILSLIIIIINKQVQASCLFSMGRAVSLRVLEKMARQGIAGGKCSNDILFLCGLKRIDGFVIDEDNSDIILIGKADAASPSLYLKRIDGFVIEENNNDINLAGKVDTSSPPLYLEDLIISLRNSWWKYAPLKGNTYYYSFPGCSIDPDPAILQKLQVVGNAILSNHQSSQKEGSFRKWHNTCRQPQQVRVMGIPFHSRFSRVLVDADYYMKRLVDGSVTINGLESLVDMTLNKAKQDIIENRAISIPLGCLNRFWFCPGETRYQEDNGIVLIEKCRVTLQTEEEFLTKTGEVAGSGQANPLSKEFSENLTDQYQHISKAKPIYSELESLFRFVALGKIMKYKGTPSKVGLNLDYWLNQYPIKETPVAQTLTGISHVKDFKHRTDYPGGYQISQLWLPSCGGVSIEITVSNKDITKDKTGDLKKIKKNVLKTRPSLGSLSWDFPAIGIIKFKKINGYPFS